VRATAGYGKVTRLEQLEEHLGIPADHVVYVGDGSSDIHVMLQVNRRDGFTIAVSESKAGSADREADGTQRQCSGNAGADPGRDCRLAAATDPPTIRILRLPDSGMGSRAEPIGSRCGPIGVVAEKATAADLSEDTSEIAGFVQLILRGGFLSA